MTATVCELETEAVKDRRQVSKIMADLIEAERDGKMAKILVCYLTPDGDYDWRVSGNVTLSEYAYVNAMFQEDLQTVIRRKHDIERDAAG